MMRRLFVFSPAVFTLAILILIMGCSKVREQGTDLPDSTVVLRVADNELTLGEIDDYFYRAYYDDIQTEYQKKKEYVEQMLGSYMMAEAAIDAGLEPGIDSTQYYEALLRELREKEVTDKVQFTDDDIREYFDKYGGETQVGHILVADSALAESLYNVLQNGADFDELAAEFSQDPTSKDRGGSLGYMELNFFDVQFMRVAADLEPGEIARPLQTSRGWHIIKLYDRIKDTPDFLDTKYRKYRSKTYSMFERRRMTEFIDEVKADYGYEIHWDTIDMMIRRADSARAAGDMPPDLPLSSYLRSDQFTDAEKQENMIEFDGGAYTVGQYAEYVEETSPDRTPELSNKVVMGDFFEKLILMPLMIREALDRGIDTLKAFRERLKDAEVNNLVQKFKTELLKDLPEISDEEIERYYNDHKDEYYTSVNMRVFAIGVKDRELAEDLIDRIEAGAVFEELARKYSVDRKSGAKGGDLGYFSRDRYPELFDAADGVKEGTLGGPVRMFGSWWIFRLIDRRPAELRSLRRARAGIVPEVRQQREKAVIDSVVAVQKAKTDYFMDLNPIREKLGLAPDDRSVQSGEQEGSS
jgi:parvulin-like peptidyl-prolyl isomerase